MDPIARLVLEELSLREWTQSKLADVAGVNRWSLQRWLAGQRSLRYAHVLRVMKVLDLRVIRGADHAQAARTNLPPPPSARRPHRRAV